MHAQLRAQLEHHQYIQPGRPLIPLDGDSSFTVERKCGADVAHLGVGNAQHRSEYGTSTKAQDFKHNIAMPRDSVRDLSDHYQKLVLAKDADNLNRVGSSRVLDSMITDRTHNDNERLLSLMLSDDVVRLKFYAPASASAWLRQPSSLKQYLDYQISESHRQHPFTAWENSQPVGLVTVSRNGSYEDANVAYWFSNKRKPGTGLATNVVADAVTKVFKRDPNVQRMFAYIDKRNDPSNKLITRAQIAFRPATRDEWADCTARNDKDSTRFNLYVMPRKDWEARQAVHA